MVRGGEAVIHARVVQEGNEAFAHEGSATIRYLSWQAVSPLKPFLGEVDHM